MYEVIFFEINAFWIEIVIDFSDWFFIKYQEAAIWDFGF